jgi:hypothetical protein
VNTAPTSPKASLVSTAVLAAVSAALGALLACASPFAAGAERDPTRPPEAARAAAPASDANPDTPDGPSADQQQALQHRMVINGQPYLVERGWLRGVGDHLGKARIERIEERAVWLRDEQGLHKLDLFPQVEIDPLPAPAAGSAPRATPAFHRRRPTAGTDLKDPVP